jgi:hypothetical protein
MPTYTKQLLSGSVNGTPILISSTSSASANPIHTAVAGTSALDEIWLYAYNDDTTTRELTVLWGGISEVTNSIRIGVPSRSGRILVCDGMLLRNGLVVSAYADTGSKVIVDGFVNNIS